MQSTAGGEPSQNGRGPRGAPGKFPCHWYRSCTAEIASGSSRQITLPKSSYTSFTLGDIVPMRDSNLDDATMNNTVAWNGVRTTRPAAFYGSAEIPAIAWGLQVHCRKRKQVTVSTTQRVTKNKVGFPNGAWLLRLADLGCTEVAKLGLGMH